MTKTHETIRIIKGVVYHCQDTGCDDFDRAARNRLIISEGLFTTFWQMMEASLAHTPLGQQLAKWIPIGILPQVGKKDWQQYGGERGGFYEIEE